MSLALVALESLVSGVGKADFETSMTEKSVFESVDNDKVVLEPVDVQNIGFRTGRGRTNTVSTLKFHIFGQVDFEKMHA